MAKGNFLCKVSRETHGYKYDLRFVRTAREPTKNELVVKLTRDQNAAIKRAVLAGRSKPKSKKTGHFFVFVRSEKQEVQWTAAYPFSELDVEPLRQGIGSRIHQVVIEHLAAKFPNYKVQHDAVFRNRRLQLEAMKINPRKTYPMQEYRKKVSDFMAEQKKKGK